MEVLSIFVELVHDSVKIYMDDFTPYGCDFEEALSNPYKLLNKCIEMNLSLSLEKCEFFMNVRIVLDHSISKEGIQVDPNNISIIKRVSIPQNKRDCKSFLGLARYYKRFIKYFSKLASPLFGLLDKDSDFCLINNCQEAFEILKEKMIIAPILRGPNWALPFHMHIDA